MHTQTHWDHRNIHNGLVLVSGQDKWLLQVKTNSGPSRFWSFFFFHLQVFSAIFPLCADLSLPMSFSLAPPLPLSIVLNEKLKLRRGHKCLICGDGGGGVKAKQAFKFTFITWLLVWEEENDVFIRGSAKFTCARTLHPLLLSPPLCGQPQ